LTTSDTLVFKVNIYIMGQELHLKQRKYQMTSVTPSEIDMAKHLREYIYSTQKVILSVWSILTYMEDPALYTPSEALVEATIKKSQEVNPHSDRDWAIRVLRQPFTKSGQENIWGKRPRQ
jgi:hypothetical protein